MDHKTSHKGKFFETEIYTSPESWINKLSIFVCLFVMIPAGTRCLYNVRLTLDMTSDRRCILVENENRVDVNICWLNVGFWLHNLKTTKSQRQLTSVLDINLTLTLDIRFTLDFGHPTSQPKCNQISTSYDVVCLFCACWDRSIFGWDTAIWKSGIWGCKKI